jgi:uncharacterized protein
MHCPLCKKPMIVLQSRELEVDYCVHCGGCWFDKGELEALSESSGSFGLISTAEQWKKGKRRCPRCHRKLRAGLFEGTATEIDVCTHDGGLWLDKGELESIIKTASPGNGMKRITELLSDMFTKP